MDMDGLAQSGGVKEGLLEETGLEGCIVDQVKITGNGIPGREMTQAGNKGTKDGADEKMTKVEGQPGQGP
jgi:hypothetical protein